MIGKKRQRAKYLIGDMLSTSISCLLFNIARYYFDGQIISDYGSVTNFLSSPMVILGQIVFPLLLIGVYALSGYYNSVFLKSRLQEFVTTVTTAFIGMIFIFFIALVNDDIHGRAFAYELLLILFGALFVPVYFVRYLITRHATHKIHNREWSFNTLIVGTSVGAVQLEKRLREMKKSMGYNIVGYVRILDDDIDRQLNLPVYHISEIEKVCEQENIKNLIVIPHRHGVKATMALVNKLLPLDCPILISPDLYQLLTSKVRISNVAGEPLVDISRTEMSHSTRNLKRFSDIVISFFALLLVSPLLLVLAILIKLDSRGPVFYRQQRIGYHKKPFYIYKFRSMKVDAEISGPALSTLNDPRITRLGRVLRKYRLDELPNFWNVLRGDMSLVGPRPEREYYIKQIMTRAPYYILIHQVRPGITSWGMVKYGYASDVEGMVERLKYDLLYIENVSMLVDLKILFYTVQTVFTGKGI